MTVIKSKEDDEIFASWNLYQKIIKHNYMFHQEMYVALLKALPKDREVLVLDLGCGDAFAISQALKEINVSSYVGIDLSADALEHARENLKILNCKVELIEGDFLEEISKLTKNFDVIIAGYSVHHLQESDTQSLFNEVKKRLISKGHFLYYDELCEEGESQKYYIERLWKIAEETWKHLTKTEFEILRKHIFQNDYPLSLAKLLKISKEATFEKYECLFRDKTKLFTFMDFG